MSTTAANVTDGRDGTSRYGHAIDPLGRNHGEAISAEIAIQGDTVEHEHLGALACAALVPGDHIAGRLATVGGMA